MQFHAVALLHALRANDRLAISKLVSSLTKASVKSPLAQCLLVRYVAQVRPFVPGFYAVLWLYSAVASSLLSPLGQCPLVRYMAQVRPSPFAPSDCAEPVFVLCCALTAPTGAL